MPCFKILQYVYLSENHVWDYWYDAEWLMQKIGLDFKTPVL